MNYFIVNPISGTFSKKQRAALYDLIASDTNNIIWKTTIENTRKYNSFWWKKLSSADDKRKVQKKDGIKRK